MRESRSRRPQLETLESVTLLSAMAGVAARSMPSVPAATVSPSTPATANSLSISGTVHGSYLQHLGPPDTGGTIRFIAIGKLSGLGHTIEYGSIQLPGFTANPQVKGTVTLVAPKGTVTLQLAQVPATTSATGGSSAVLVNSYHLGYTITAGTGAFAGDQGSGTVDLKLYAPSAKSVKPVGNTFGSITVVYSAAPVGTSTAV